MMRMRSMNKIKIRTNKGEKPPRYADAYQINFRRTQYGKSGITYIVYGGYHKAKQFIRETEVKG